MSWCHAENASLAAFLSSILQLFSSGSHFVLYCKNGSSFIMAVFMPSLKNRVVYSSNSRSAIVNSQAKSSLIYKSWSETSMDNALDAVISKGWSIRRAADSFNVPKSTLGDRVSGRVANYTLSGPRKILNDEQEEVLANFLIGCASIGYAKSRSEVMGIVNQIYKSRGIDKLVSNGWWDGFCKRHPNLTLRAAPCLSQTRYLSSHPSILEQYFDVLEKTFTEYDLMQKPHMIFNMDETGVPFDPCPPRCIFEKGERRPTVLTSGTKGQFTVVGCVNAAGFCLPPMVIIDRKKLNPAITKGEIPGTSYGLTAKGWMDQDIFNLWFRDHFLKHIPSSRPIILLMDGHKSHYNPDTIQFASKERIILFTLPPNTTHVSQPLDRSCFGPFKLAWREACHRFTCSTGQVVTRNTFSQLLNEAWSIAMTRSNIISGFKVTGIYPFDRTALIPQSAPVVESQLPYIPLLTPKRRSCRRESAELSNASFDDHDISCSPEDSTAIQLHKRSSLSDALQYPQPITPPKTAPKSLSARVLTSDDNIKAIQQRELAKEKAAQEKELKKAARAEKKALKAKKKTQRVVPREESDDEYLSQSLFEEEFSAEEINIFMKRYENGYDLKHDARYNKWKEQYEAGEQSHEETEDNAIDTSLAASATKSKRVPANKYSSSKGASSVIGTGTTRVTTRGKSKGISVSQDLSVKTATSVNVRATAGKSKSASLLQVPNKKAASSVNDGATRVTRSKSVSQKLSVKTPTSVNARAQHTTCKSISQDSNVKPASVNGCARVTRSKSVSQELSVKTATSVNARAQHTTCKSKSISQDSNEKTASVNGTGATTVTRGKTKSISVSQDLTASSVNGVTGATCKIKSASSSQNLNVKTASSVDGATSVTASDDLSQKTVLSNGNRTTRGVTGIMKSKSVSKVSANGVSDDSVIGTSKPQKLTRLASSDCVKKHCKHPSAYNWVKCHLCKGWYHCICVKITRKKAEELDTYVCWKCQ